MRAVTIAVLFFAFAGLSLAAGIDWLVVVFIALGAAMLFFYKEAAEAEEEEEYEGQPSQPPVVPQQQIVVVQEPGLMESLSEKIVEELELEKMLGKAKFKK
jgi:hypothetical protein